MHYFQRPRAYKKKITRTYGGFEFVPDIEFYRWFYQFVKPVDHIQHANIIHKMQCLFVRDISRLLDKKVKIVGALASMCEVRKFTFPDAWKFFYLHYYLAHADPLRHVLLYHLPRVAPFHRRYSWRLCEVDASVFQCYGLFGARGCYDCAHQRHGCSSCLEGGLQSYKKCAIDYLHLQLPYHKKCRGAGCRICYHKQRKELIQYNDAHHLYPRCPNRSRLL